MLAEGVGGRERDSGGGDIPQRDSAVIGGRGELRLLEGCPLDVAHRGRRRRLVESRVGRVLQPRHDGNRALHAMDEDVACVARGGDVDLARAPRERANARAVAAQREGLHAFLQVEDADRRVAGTRCEVA